MSNSYICPMCEYKGTDSNEIKAHISGHGLGILRSQLTAERKRTAVLNQDVEEAMDEYEYLRDCVLDKTPWVLGLGTYDEEPGNAGECGEWAAGEIKRLTTNLDAKREEVSELKRALRDVIDVVHNMDCIFRGLKDKRVIAAHGGGDE